MKYVLIILALLTLVPSISRADSSTLAVDKAAHFGISFIATETGYAIGKKMKAGQFQSGLSSALLVNAAGIIKETAIDRKADTKDILANVTGSISAGIFVWAFEF